MGALVFGLATAVSLGIGYLIGKEVQKEEDEEKLQKEGNASSSSLSSSSSSSAIDPKAETWQDEDAHLCKVCFERPNDVVLFPCKHQFACMECVKHLPECGICRAKIKNYVQVFKA